MLLLISSNSRYMMRLGTADLTGSADSPNIEERLVAEVFVHELRTFPHVNIKIESIPFISLKRRPVCRFFKLRFN